MPLIKRLYHPTTRLSANIYAQHRTHLPAAFINGAIRHKSTIEKAKDVAHDANLRTGKKLSEAIDSAEDVADIAAEKVDHLKKQIKHEIEHDLKEKTIAEAVKDISHKANIKAGKSIYEGVNIVNKVVENAKDTIGIGSKKAGHDADELKNEAKLHIKKAVHDADEIKEKATKAAKEVKHKASH